VTEPRDPSEQRDPRDARDRSEPRPWLERIGMAAIAAILGSLLVVVALAAFATGELILAAMAISGAILTIGIGLLTLIRG
jgi:uncharacterized membrane protein YkgB